MGTQSKGTLPAQKAVGERPIAANDNASKGSESKNPMRFLRNAGRMAKNTFTNPKVQIYGAAGIAAASCTVAALLREPNISGTMGGIITGVDCLPQALLSFKRKTTRDISLGFLTLNAAAVMGFTTYGFMIHSMPLIIADAFCFAFNTVPLTIKVRETVSDIKERREAERCADATINNGDTKTDDARLWGRILRVAKERLRDQVLGLSVATAPIVVAIGTTASSIITGNPNVVGSYSAAICGGICIPQAWHSATTRKVDDLSLLSMLICFVGELNWITYGVMIRAPPVIWGDSGVALFGAVPLTIKIAEVLSKKKAAEQDQGS
jgi:MtN3 and saliva related transmembrane protein